MNVLLRNSHRGMPHHFHYRECVRSCLTPLLGDRRALISLVKDEIGIISGIGDLTIYDIAHRLGAYFGNAGRAGVGLRYPAQCQLVPKVLRLYTLACRSANDFLKRVLLMPSKLLICGAPGMTRTCDLLVRSQTLYPTELRARAFNRLTDQRSILEHLVVER
jgi:hypothetical protein